MSDTTPPRFELFEIGDPADNLYLLWDNLIGALVGLKRPNGLLGVSREAAELDLLARNGGVEE